MRFSAVAIISALAAVASAHTPADTSKPPSGNPISLPGLEEQVPVGKPYTITWEATTPGKVSIILLRGPSDNVVPIETLADAVPNNGHFEWTPAKSLEPDVTHYGLQIIVEGSGQYQYSTQFGIKNDNQHTEEPEPTPEPTYPTDVPEPTYPTDVPEPTYPTDVPEPTYPTEVPEPTYTTEAPEPTYPTDVPEPTDAEPTYPTDVPEPSYPTEAPEPTYPTEAPEPTYPTDVPEPTDAEPTYPTEVPEPSYPTDVPEPTYPTEAPEPTYPTEPTYVQPSYTWVTVSVPTPPVSSTPSVSPTPPTSYTPVPSSSAGPEPPQFTGAAGRSSAVSLTGVAVAGLAALFAF